MTMKGETVITGAKHPGSKMEVLQSPAGYYLGFKERGMPYSRETEYIDNIQTATDLLSWFRQ